MNSFYIKKNRAVELDKIIALWFNFIGWTKSLVDPVDVKYIKSKGIRGLDLYFFLILFYPFWFIKSFGFNGVPFPFNLLKKKKKEIVAVHKKKNDLKSQIKSLKSKSKILKRERKALDPGTLEHNSVSLSIDKVSEKRTKLISTVKKIDAKVVKKKSKKNMSNNSYLARLKKRDKILLSNPKKIRNSELAFNIFFHIVNRKKLGIDTSSLESIVNFKIYDSFIHINYGSMENIRQSDIFGWLEKHKTTKEFNLFLKGYLLNSGFVFKEKSFGELFTDLYGNK